MNRRTVARVKSLSKPCCTGDGGTRFLHFAPGDSKVSDFLFPAGSLLPTLNNPIDTRQRIQAGS